MRLFSIGDTVRVTNDNFRGFVSSRRRRSWDIAKYTYIIDIDKNVFPKGDERNSWPKYNCYRLVTFKPNKALTSCRLMLIEKSTNVA